MLILRPASEAGQHQYFYGVIYPARKFGNMGNRR
jgi:hypothetical protein